MQFWKTYTVTSWLPMLTLCGVFCQSAVAQQEIPNPFDLLPGPDASASPQANSRGVEDQSQPTVVADGPGQEPALKRAEVGSAEPVVTAADAENADQIAITPNHELEKADVLAEVENAIPAVVDAGDANADEMPNAQQPPAEPQPRIDNVLTQRYQNAMLIDLQGGIFGKFHWYLNNRLDLAKEQGADLVIMRLTTPGGDAEASLQLARRLRDLDWATTIIFIPEEAISGGAIISFGADRIYMQKGALIGDAGPIRLGMRGFEHAEEKVVSYLAEAISELATAKGRPGAIAEAMVDRKLVVLEAVEVATAATVFLTQEQVDANPAGYRVVGPVPETQQDRFLTVAADRAEALGLCEGVFASEQDLLAALDIAKLTQTKLSWVDTTVYWLNLPWLTALLLIIGLIGLYFELAAPGISVAGLTAAVCFTVFFWSHALGGTAGWLEILMFLVGVTCMICEIFLLPGFGVFGISGIALVALSLIMASQDFLVPDSPQQWSQLQTNVNIVLGSVLGVMLLFIAQVLLLDTIPGLNRFRLAAPEVEPVAAPESMEINRLIQTTGTAWTSAVGEQGVAESDLRPSGKVLIDRRLLDVVTEGDYVSAGTPVEIIKIEGNRVVVRRL